MRLRRKVKVVKQFILFVPSKILEDNNMKLADIHPGKVYQINFISPNPELSYIGKARVLEKDVDGYRDKNCISCLLLEDKEGYDNGVFTPDAFVEEVSPFDLDKLTTEIQSLVRDYPGLLGSCDLWQKIHAILKKNLP